MRISVRAVACAASLLSQTLASPPAFEVVSVKPFNPPGEISFRTYPGGRIVAHGITLEDLIEVVLDVQSFQITGGPGWMKSYRFEIEAKPPALATRPGGNSARFDWGILAGWKPNFPWLMAGGLTPKNVSVAINVTGAPAVDVSSGVERSPGVKDSAMIRAFIQAAKAA